MIFACHLGTLARLFAGMMAGLAFSGFGLLVFGAIFGLAPQAGPDPVVRFDLTKVSPPEVLSGSPVYQPIWSGTEQIGLLAVFGGSAPPNFVPISAPASNTIESQAAFSMAEIKGEAPRLDLPAPGSDQPFRLDLASMSETGPRLGKVGGSLSAIGTEPPLSLNAVPRNVVRTASTQPEHFLQTGYFADRENAVGLSEDLTKAGLDVLMVQTANRAGLPRWRVLVGPFRKKDDALRARSAAPELLADAFPIVQGD